MQHFRILHVITRLDKGGSAENTLLTAAGNCAHGHHVEIICGVSDIPPSENEEMIRQKGIAITRLNCLVREIAPLKDVMALLQLYRYMKKHPCDVLHSHTSKAGIVGRLAGMLAGVQCIVHTPHGHIFYGYFSPFVTRLLVAVERFVTNRTSALITLTKKERDDYLERKIGTPETIVPILSGIDLQPFLQNDFDKASVRKELGLPIDGYIAGTIARLVSVKNHELIISAAKRIAADLPKLMFVFVGDGDLHEKLVADIQRSGLSDRFVLLGWRSDTPRLLKAFDLFIMCSHNEGMGRAFVEAQASGLPVIGSRVGGVSEVLREGITGYLVAPNDSVALAQFITMMYNKQDDREGVTQACRDWVNPRFGKEVMVDAIEAVYRQQWREK
jgi:glycosyltransferase involved in cell wall biosynthesis